MPVVRLPCGVGLHTDPSALSTQPGALRVADNVMLHRPGSAQPRPGFGDTTGVASRSTDFRPVRIAPYTAAGVIVVQSTDGTDWRLERLGTTTTFSSTTSQVQPPDETVRGTSEFMEARGCLYHTGADGIRKLSVDGAASYRRAGIWQTYQPAAYSLIAPAASSDQVAIDADSTVAYRWLVKRTDEQDNELRSAPSSRLIVKAPSGIYANGAWAELGSIYLPTDALAGDVVELYRTPNSGSLSVDPGEDYYLVTTYTLTSTDISNGYTSDDALVDDVDDDQLGVALYTSSSQLGALAAKEIPPLGQTLTWWGDVAWSGNVWDRHSLPLSLNKVAYQSGATVRLEGEGLCYLKNGSYSGVSGNDLTGVSFSTGFGWSAIAVGMWVTDGGIPGTSSAGIPIGTKITAYDSGAGTITLSNTPTGSGTFYCGDVVTVDGSDFYAYSTESISGRVFILDIDESDLTERCYLAARSLAACISVAGAMGTIDVYAWKDGYAGNVGTGDLFLISALPKSTGSFAVQCASRPLAFAPEISASTDSPDAQAINRLRWSAPDEPEAWPPSNSADIGQQDYRILATVPLRGALLVFKEDGLWRVTGSAPSSWVVDDLDPTLRLVAPEAWCVLEGICYAWTDRGVVAVTEGGVAGVVSQPINDVLREEQRNYPLGDTGVKRGAYMVAHPRLRLVVLAVASDSDAEDSDEWWVYHLATNAWAKWAREDRCASYDPAEDRLMVGLGGSAWRVVYERSDEDSAKSYRDQTATAITISNVSGATFTVVKTDVPWTPTTCDVVTLLSEPNVTQQITAVADSGTDWTLTVGSDIGGSPTTATLYQGYQCTMRWQAQHVPGLSTRWSEVHAQLLSDASQYLSTWELDVGGRTDRDTTSSTVAATITPEGAASHPVRVGPPRACVRASQYYPEVGVCGAGILWRLAELQLHARPVERRQRR